MGGFIEPSPSIQERDSNRIPILVGMVLVVVIVGIIVLFSRGQSKGNAAPHPYAANLKISDLKMSAAENFVGATVTYLDAVDLSTSPLAPAQSKPFRLTFEHVTDEWNHEFPELSVRDVSLK